MAVESFDASCFASADDLKGFSEPEAGQYHMAVVEVDTSREKGNAIIVKFAILAGTVQGQQNKTFREFFNDPSSTHKDGGAFVQKRRAKLLLATGVMTPDMFGKQFNLDWQMLVNRQLKAAIIVEDSESKTDPTKKYKNAKIEGLDIWGPLDDESKHIPQDQVCIDAAYRSGQANVVSKMGPPTGMTAPPAAAPTAQTGLPPAVDKYASL